MAVCSWVSSALSDRITGSVREMCEEKMSFGFSSSRNRVKTCATKREQFA